MQTSSNSALIIDQFTRQATPFAEKPEHRDEAIMERLRQFSGVTAEDEVLDVACGPGLVTCAFATRARKVTGIDLTPAMIAKARERQRELGLGNVAWEVGDSCALPYPDATFSMVVTRYSFHHFPDPKRAWREMVRVCRPGGTVVVIDVALPAAKVIAYDHFETLRDPSHTHALTLEEFPAMAREVGLHEIRTDFFRLPMESEHLLNSSFPDPANRPRLSEMLRADLGLNALGFEVEQRDGEFWMSYPTLAVAGKKAVE